jgi:hypothetical protein
MAELLIHTSKEAYSPNVYIGNEKQKLYVKLRKAVLLTRYVYLVSSETGVSRTSCMAFVLSTNLLLVLNA